MRTRASKLALLAALLLLLATVGTASAADQNWTKKSFDVKGSWSIVEEGGKSWIVLDDSFATKKAPDLKLFLSKKSGAELNGKNAADGVLVAKLDSHKGGQRYAIPATVDLSQYSTLALHCEKYSKLWAVSQLP
ncbi:MAG: DM13 domain-containing protein [Acidobacteriota bacterium]